MLEVCPKISFSEFIQKYFPDIKTSYHEEVIKKLEEFAGAPNHLILQGARPINWYKSLSLMRHTFESVRNGENCVVATGSPDLYVKNMKAFFDADIELEEQSTMYIYRIKLKEPCQE